MTINEAETWARQIWPLAARVAAVRSHDGQCRLGPCRLDGSFVAWYCGPSWAVVVRRARRNMPYDSEQTTLHVTAF